MSIKVYNEIGLSRLLDIRVIKDDIEKLYEEWLKILQLKLKI